MPQSQSPTLAAIDRRALLQGAVASAAALALPAWAQSTWPAKPVTLVVPFPAGGGTDAFARPLSAQFARLTDKQLIIDNKGGAGGTLGAGVAAKAAADGYTLFMGAVHHTIAPSMYPKLDYDLERDFVPLLLVASVPQILVVNPKKVPVANFAEFLAFVRKNPGKLNYGSAGNGSAGHLAFEYLKMVSDTFILHVPYRGTGPMLTDLMAGRLDAAAVGAPALLQFIKAGKLRCIATGTSTRLPQLPDVPTVAEQGFKGFEMTQWYGLMAPSKMAKANIDKLEKEAIAAARSKIVNDKLSQDTALAVGNTRVEFEAFIKLEQARWKPVIARAQIKPEGV